MAESKIKWNTIDFTQKSWIEFNDDNGENTNILCINKSLEDIINEYGEDNWEVEAEQNGDIVRFNPYDNDRELAIDKFVFEKFGEII